MNGLGKYLIILGLGLAGLGACLAASERYGWLRSLLGRFGRLPGDIVVSRPGFTFHFPWVTCLVISIVLSLALAFISRK